MSALAAPCETGALVKRLHRIEGQVRGIEKMLVERRACIDVLTQIAAASTALDALALRILDSHVHTCLEEIGSDDAPAARAKREELFTAVQRFTRSR